MILLDAFGRRFLERHAGHPFLRRLEVTEIASQFPSTTTAHVTTMHTGVPVGTHGLYEWNVYEPSLDEVIVPILYAPAGEKGPDGLRGSGVGIGDIGGTSEGMGGTAPASAPADGGTAPISGMLTPEAGAVAGSAPYGLIPAPPVSVPAALPP